MGSESPSRRVMVQTLTERLQVHPELNSSDLPALEELVCRGFPFPRAGEAQSSCDCKDFKFHVSSMHLQAHTHTEPKALCTSIANAANWTAHALPFQVIAQPRLMIDASCAVEALV